jgi:alpha-beta hydrolase superfamily lysophospholipase
MQHTVYFSHGKESGPDGIKIRQLSTVARAHGFAVHSIDYRGMDDIDQRVQHLLAQIARSPNASGKPNSKLVLVGSSMGAYVSVAASEQVQPVGLFLLAPAVLIPGLGRQDIKPVAQITEAVHAWEDEIVPVDGVLRFAQQHKIKLHLLSGDHWLTSVLPEIEILFANFLQTILQI